MIKKDPELTKRIREAWEAQQARLPRGAKLQQSAVASNAGVAPSTLGRWLKGEMAPSLGQLKPLAEALEVSHYWLAHGDGEMRRSVQTPIESTAAVPMDRGPDDSGEGDQPRQVREQGKP